MDLTTFAQVSNVNLINLSQVSDFLWAIENTYNNISGPMKVENFLTA